MRRHDSGFTLVELLVVVMVIVLLIAILLPALQRANYEAQLASCMSNLRTIAQGAYTYAIDNVSNYPHRPTLRLGGTWQRPNNIVDPRVAGADDRPFIQNHIGYKVLADPLSGRIDLSDVTPGAHAFSNYELWFGTEYPGETGLFKTSDRLTYAGQSYRTLVSDEDKLLTGWGSHAGHPDELTKQSFIRDQNAGGFVISRYQLYTGGAPSRPPVDTQHAFSDVSVHRVVRVQWDEYLRSDRMARIPFYQSNDMNNWSYIPRD